MNPGKKSSGNMNQQEGLVRSMAIVQFAASLSKRLSKRRSSCRSACYSILKLARCGSPIVGGNRRDALGLVARMVWNTRRNNVWEIKNCFL